MFGMLVETHLSTDLISYLNISLLVNLWYLLILHFWPQDMVGKQRYSVSSSVKIGFWPSAGAIQRISLFGSIVLSVTRVLMLGALGSSSLLLSSSSELLVEFLFCVRCSSSSSSGSLIVFRNMCNHSGLCLYCVVDIIRWF